jgi:hypothetical protein
MYNPCIYSLITTSHTIAIPRNVSESVRVERALIDATRSSRTSPAEQSSRANTLHTTPIQVQYRPCVNDAHVDRYFHIYPISRAQHCELSPIPPLQLNVTPSSSAPAPTVAFNYFRVQVAPGMNQLKWKTTAVDPSRYGARENCGPANTV